MGIYEGSSSDDDLDVVFVEHRSIANANNNIINREPIVAKLRRDVSMQADKAAGKMVGRQREELAVPVRKTDKMLGIEQWQAAITLQQQAWEEADKREQGTPLREADQKWLKMYNKSMRKVVTKKKRCR